MKLTDEQKKIVRHDLSDNDVMLIKAFAGTGKTTTLIEYSKARPDKRFLYIAFNKSVQLDASANFPTNVTCKTAHSLAWPKYGAKYRDRLTTSFRANTVMEVLGLDSFEQARFVIDTLMNYLVSAAPKVSQRHIPLPARIVLETGRLQLTKSALVAHANRLGRLMCNGEDPDIGMLHDGYLKLYQLSEPRLRYDCIMLDEAQDINPVQAAIVLPQQGISKILVGDEHQAIYSFRGAVNTMASVAFTDEFYLTQSFRFGNSVAKVANMILNEFKGEARKVRGLREKASGRKANKFTVIARTNAMLFKEAVKRHHTHKIGFVGGIAGYRFDKILDVYYLSAHQKKMIKDPYIRCFDSYGAMGEYAKAVEDYELISIKKVVDEFKGLIPRYVKKIKTANVDLDDAQILLSTAHKAKGLEFGVVRIADDFPDLVHKEKIIGSTELSPDEFNLMYVACTRAKDSLRFAQGCSLINFIVQYQKK